MNKKLISLVVGARPNFMKIAPLVRALENVTKDFIYRIIHTGQHNHSEMNEVFFAELGIPSPDIYLKGSGGSHAEQTAKIMIEFERECIKFRPDIVLVVGDINSTLACAIVAKKLHIKLVHVEAGLRSGDQKMPEEINRILTDSISDLFFVTEQSGLSNLLSEGHDLKNIHFVGNVMIDNLIYQKEKLNNLSKDYFSSSKLKNKLKKYAVLTLHRPSNVDNLEIFSEIIKSLNEISISLPIIFPVHPRTRKSIDKFKLSFNENIFLTKPLSYLEFLNLWKDAEVVLTDSGGLQEETSALGISCITIRNNTERPITIEKGTNTLAGNNPNEIINVFNRVISTRNNKINQIEMWDGNAAKRIVEVLLR
jgi:UDP-N-acetylglucosamine 2-epimerase (non-hydrolysing)